MRQRTDALLAVKGAKTPRQLHRELGAVLWDHVGMSRNDAGLSQALGRIPQLREEFWQSVSVPSSSKDLNRNLEFRVAEKTGNLTKAYERLQQSNQNLAIVNRDLETANRKLKELDQLKSDFISVRESRFVTCVPNNPIWKMFF